MFREKQNDLFSESIDILLHKNRKKVRKEQKRKLHNATMYLQLFLTSDKLL
jgi:hypothetical protein